VFIAYSFKKMKDFQDYDVNGAVWEPEPARKSISESDCGDGKFVMGNANDVNSAFNSACNAKNRMKWLVPTTVGFAALGAGALIYVMISKDESEQRPAGARRTKKSRNLLVTPVVSPDNTGATLRFDW